MVFDNFFTFSYLEEGETEKYSSHKRVWEAFCIKSYFRNT